MDQGSLQSPDQLYGSSKSSKGSKTILFTIITIIILAGLAFGGYKLFTASTSFDEEEEEEFVLEPTLPPTQTPTPTSTISATLTPSSRRVSPTKAVSTPTPSTSPKPTQNPMDKTTGLDRSKLTVEVLNGSGIAGSAKKAADLLTELGYSISSTGNADSYEYENTVIEVKSTKSDYLSLLKKDLSGSYTVGSSSASLSTTTNADARVIVGKQ